MLKENAKLICELLRKININDLKILKLFLDKILIKKYIKEFKSL